MRWSCGVVAALVCIWLLWPVVHSYLSRCGPRCRPSPGAGRRRTASSAPEAGRHGNASPRPGRRSFPAEASRGQERTSLDSVWEPRSPKSGTEKKQGSSSMTLPGVWHMFFIFCFKRHYKILSLIIWTSSLEVFFRNYNNNDTMAHYESISSTSGSQTFYLQGVNCVFGDGTFVFAFETF